MNKFKDPGPKGPEPAVRRVADLSRLFEAIRRELEQMIRTFGMPEADTPRAVLVKLKEIQAVHLWVMAAEEALHGKTDPADDIVSYDLDILRAEIGGQLDRIRSVIVADRLSFGSDTCATCGAALSV